MVLLVVLLLPELLLAAKLLVNALPAHVGTEKAILLALIDAIVVPPAPPPTHQHQHQLRLQIQRKSLPLNNTL